MKVKKGKYFVPASSLPVVIQHLFLKFSGCRSRHK